MTRRIIVHIHHWPPADPNQRPARFPALLEDDRGQPLSKPYLTTDRASQIGVFFIAAEALLVLVALCIFLLHELTRPRLDTQVMQAHVEADPGDVAYAEIAPAIDAFLYDLNTGHVAEAHGNLHALVTSLPPGAKRAEAARRYASIHDQTLPRDYRYFFKESLPAFLEPTPSSSLQDDNILLSLNDSEAYTADIVFNSRQSATFPRHAGRPAGYPKHRLEITGGYTSSYIWPAGLTISAGRVLNGALQSWDGLIIKDAQNRLHIVDLSDLRYNFRRYDLRGDLDDYKAFLQIAAKEKWSVVQTHLLLSSGQLLVSSEGSSLKARRRALFEMEDGTLAVYDSFDESLTLFELASILRDRYQATDAVNLDMGTYNYCVFYESGQETQSYSVLGEGGILSNLLVFDYQ